MCNTISIAKPQDLDKINHLFSAIRADSDSHYKPPVDYTLDDVRQTGKNRVVFVAKDNGRIAGYLDLHSERSFQTDNIATFEMGVHPHGRLKGCATSLLKETLQYVREETKLQRFEIKVLKNNLKAKRLFIKIGFCYLNQSHPKGDDMALNIER